MSKNLLFTVIFFLIAVLGFSQTDEVWLLHIENSDKIPTDKAVTRLSFPKEFKLFNLNIGQLKQELFTIVGNQAGKHTTVISLPNAAGNIEQFEVVEASNFEPALQALFPEIRAYSGKGISDKYATLKLSISPQGIQAMIFRSDKDNEFVEVYSRDHTVYAAFKSQRSKGMLPWSCSTDDHAAMSDIKNQIANTNRLTSSTGELKTMRLAQSVTAEYSNYFGAFSAAQVGLVLAAINATLARCNGVYEKDLALHLNLIATSTSVIFYDPATDPYSPAAIGAGGAWNGELQATLTSVIGDANYDIGHLFGATGGGGNAGCIGCVCESGKGSGFTSPADGIPQGDNFDIDYVVHEVGHQIGANHTFSFNNENSGNNKEIGSGITIMGYAGITAYDVAPHSIDIFHETSIQQIQNNLATKTCPITTSLAGANATPVVTPVSNYTIPLSTPFVLTGSATDANAGDVLTYCWEQNDQRGSATGASSSASTTKTVGPNFLSFSPTASPLRYFPRYTSILSNSYTTTALQGGNPNVLIEALSSVGRTLNFRLTVRDNSPYSSTAPIKVGQTAFTDMVVTVTNTSGPFQVTSPNTNVSYPGGSTQTITWDVNNTTLPPVSCANVKISYSTDGGITFPTVLTSNTPNDGTEALTIPVGATSTARIKVEAVGNIFFDISNSNFIVTAPVNEFNFTPSSVTTTACPAGSPTVTIATTVIGAFTTPIALTASGVPTGTTLTFAPNTLTPGSSSVATLNNASILSTGTYNIMVTGIADSSIKTTTITFIVPAGAVIATQPTDQTVCNGISSTFNVTVSGSGLNYQWQQSSLLAGPYTNVTVGTGAGSSSYKTEFTTPAMNNSYYRVIAANICGSSTSVPAKLTVNTVAIITAQPIAQTACIPAPASFSVTAIGTGLTYQWQISSNNGTSYTDIPSAIGSTYTTGATSPTLNGNLYRVNILSICSPTTPITSNAVSLTAINPVIITQNPSSQSGCALDNYTFTVTATGGNLTYQWQLSTDGGATYSNVSAGIPISPTTSGITSTYTINNALLSLSGNFYRVIVTGQPCGIVITPGAQLKLSNKPSVVLTAPATSNTNPGVNSMIFATVSPANANILYSWKRNGVLIPNTLTSASITLAIDDEATYQVTIIDISAGCQSTSNTINTLASRSDNLLAGRVFIYPNPVTTMMQVRFNNSTSTNRGTMLNIYDDKGVRVFSKSYSITGTLGRMDVDMSRMPNGTYVVYIMDYSGKKLGGSKVVKLN